MLDRTRGSSHRPSADAHAASGPSAGHRSSPATASPSGRAAGDAAWLDPSLDLEPLVDQVEILAGIDFDLVHPDALGEVVWSLSRAVSRLEAVRTRALAAFDARRAYRADGERSSADWLADQLNLDKRDARRQARLAKALPALPDTAAAYQAGDISADHADIICRSVPDPSSPDGQQAEAELLEAATKLSPAQLAREARRRQIENQPADASRTAKRQWESRRATRHELDDGMVRWDIVSDPASAEFLDAAIARLSAPDPTSLPDDQRRPKPQRAHDALVTLAKRALDRDELPAKHGPSTTGLVIIDHDTLTAGDGDGRLAAELGINGPIDATTARALLCDAGVARVLIDSDGHVLDLGRTSQTCSDAQRAAVYARDKGCRRCGASVMDCEVHHIIEWADLGPTDLWNLIALCWPCHRVVHLAGWRIQVHDDLSVTFSLGNGREITRPSPRCR